MKLEDILPEIYTFVDFTKHEYYKADRKGEHIYKTHLAGGIPEDHAMPYNVYVPVREYLKRNPEDIDDVIEHLTNEFTSKNYNFTNVQVEVSEYVEKKGLFKKKWPQIDVTLEW